MIIPHLTKGLSKSVPTTQFAHLADAYKRELEARTHESYLEPLGTLFSIQEKKHSSNIRDVHEHNLFFGNTSSFDPKNNNHKKNSHII